MYGSFQYGLKSRFYGLFSQLPWSLVVTAIVLLPVIYFATPETRLLVIEIALYWSLVVGVLMLLKDLLAQKYIFEFVVQGRGITVYKKTDASVDYTWEQITSIKPFNKRHSIARRAIESDGVLLKFEDGFELPVFEPVSNYKTFNNILRSITN